MLPGLVGRDTAERVPGGQIRRVAIDDEQFYRHANRVLELAGRAYRIIRRPLYNRLGLLAVLGGLLLASGSFWVDLFTAFAGEYLQATFPNTYSIFSAAWRQYEAKIDQVNVVCGSIIVALGLSYHWLASKFDRIQRMHELNSALERLNEERARDKQIIHAFDQRFPFKEFEKSVVSLMDNQLSARITELNERYAFWRNPVHGFQD